MKPRLAAAVLILLWFATPAFAHRLDEYLQATTFAIEKDRVAIQMRLTPGVDVLRKLLKTIDANGDGVISEGEQRSYLERVCGDVSLTIDDHPVQLRIVSSTFPKLDEMNEGLGDILLNCEAAIPPGGSDRKLTFANHHQSDISVYLMNCLVPSDPNIHIIAQDRNYDQSFYQLNYRQAASNTMPPHSGVWANLLGGLSRTGSASLFKAFFYHGVHHILTGYDHLLFVSALVLAATTLWELVKVVSAFTLAHTITLTLAALHLVHVPGRVVEPLIALSIIVIALQKVFWLRRARGWSRLGAAFFFGLFHGLGFAGGLLDAMREMQGGTMLLAILAFSIGVEVGHQLIVSPLFAILKAARDTRPDTVIRTRLSMRLQRIGSAGISVAGFYYLCLAFAGRS